MGFLEFVDKFFERPSFPHIQQVSVCDFHIDMGLINAAYLLKKDVFWGDQWNPHLRIIFNQMASQKDCHLLF
jgi:hypothetical protein